MSKLKRIALTLLAVALPCFAWATDKWADITTSLPEAASSLGKITSFHSGDFSGKQGTVAGAMVALEKWLTINPGEVKVAWNQNTASGTTGGDAEGAEGYWSENHSITLWGRNGISGMSAAIALADNAILNELKIKQVRVTGKVRGSYANANSESVNTASGSCALAVGVARYDGSTYVCAAAAGAQATGGNGSDVAFTATLDIPYADVKAWNASGTNNDKIILTVSTPSATWNNVYIVQIDTVEYLTLENYEAATMPVPNAVQLINFGAGTADTSWTVQTDQTAAGQIVLDGFSVTKASSAGNFGSGNITDKECTAFPTEGGAYVALDGTSCATVFAEMKQTLKLSEDVPATCYSTGLVNAGQSGHTVTVKNLDPSRTYVMYYVGGGKRPDATQTIGGLTLQANGYAGNPIFDLATSTSTDLKYVTQDSPTAAVRAGSGVYMVARFSNIKPTADGEIRFDLTSDRAGINAFAIAEMDRVLNDTAENWVNEAKWRTPTATSISALTLNNNATLTADAAATAGTLTINNAVGKDYELTFAGESLTTKTLNVNANTDVSDITSNLGAVTVAEDKTLTLGPVATSTVTSVTGNGNLVLGSGVWTASLSTAEITLTSGTEWATSGTLTPTTINVNSNDGFVGIYNNTVTNGNHPFQWNATTKVTGSGNLLLGGQSGAGGSHLKFTLTASEDSDFTGNIYTVNRWANPSQTTLSGNAFRNAVYKFTTAYNGEVSGCAKGTSTASILYLAGDATLAGVDSAATTSETIKTSVAGTSPTLTLAVAEGKSHSFAGTFGDTTTPLSLVKSGAGTQTFGTAYLNNLTMTAGTLALGSSTIGSLAGEGGTLTLNSATSIGALGETTTYSGTITGSSALTLTGGTLTLTGAQPNYSGSVALTNNATLELAAPTFDGTEAKKTFADSKIINTAANTTVKLTSGGGFFNIQGTGTVVADGGTDFVYGIGSNTNNTISANLVVPENGVFRVRSFHDTNAIAGGDITVNGTITVEYVDGYSKDLAITINEGKTLSGTGALGTNAVDLTSKNVNLTFAAGSTFDATAATAEKRLTVTGTVTLPETGTMTINVDGLTAETTILSCAASTLDVSKIELINADNVIVEANEAGTALVLAAEAADEEYTGNFSVGTAADILDAVADITAAAQNETLTGSETITLTTAIDDLAETLVIDVGEGNTVTIDLNGKMLAGASGLDTTVLVKSGALNVTSSANEGFPAISSSDGVAIVVGADEDGNAVTEACALNIGAGVYVMTSAFTAVNVTSGTISGTGMIYYGTLVLGADTTIDASAGTLTVNGTVTWPTAKVNFNLGAVTTSGAVPLMKGTENGTNLSVPTGHYAVFLGTTEITDYLDDAGGKVYVNANILYARTTNTSGTTGPIWMALKAITNSETITGITLNGDAELDAVALFDGVATETAEDVVTVNEYTFGVSDLAILGTPTSTTTTTTYTAVAKVELQEDLRYAAGVTVGLVDKNGDDLKGTVTPVKDMAGTEFGEGEAASGNIRYFKFTFTVVDGESSTTFGVKAKASKTTSVAE